jgi:hypothetical protein
MKTTQNTRTCSTVSWLLAEIENFLTINSMENDGCAFGWYIMRDRSLVSRLRDGGDVTTKKMDDILAFMLNPVTTTRSGEPKKLNLKPLTITRRQLP